jgi:hypothetical protein
MGSKQEIGRKRGFAPASLLLVVALSLSLSPVLAPPCRANDPLQSSSGSAGATDQAQGGSAGNFAPRGDPAAVHTVIDQSEADGIQRDWPAPKPAPVPEPLPKFSLNLAWLPYAILVLIGAGLLFLAVRYLSYRTGLKPADRDRPAAGGTSTYALAADEAERDHTFDEVDALAAQGAFAEAIHRLLLLVQERLRSRLEHGYQTSLTSREILRRAKLPGDAKTAFGGLVAAVEITLFGQQPANLATYQLCRENSRRVLAAA